MRVPDVIGGSRVLNFASGEPSKATETAIALPTARAASGWPIVSGIIGRTCSGTPQGKES